MGKDRKKRPKSHAVADAGVKHVEYLAALAGFTTVCVPSGSDYGFDVVLSTFDDEGYFENGYVLIQVKSSERLHVSASGHTIPVRVERKHLEHWLAEPMPVILVRHDAARGSSYWVYVQRYFSDRKRPLAKSVVIQIPRRQTLTRIALKRFASYKLRVILQMRSVVTHG